MTAKIFKLDFYEAGETKPSGSMLFHKKEHTKWAANWGKTYCGKETGAKCVVRRVKVSKRSREYESAVYNSSLHDDKTECADCHKFNIDDGEEVCDDCMETRFIRCQLKHKHHHTCQHK